MTTADSVVVNTHFGGNLRWEAYGNGVNELEFLIRHTGVAVDLSDRAFVARFRAPGSNQDTLMLVEDAGLTKDLGSLKLTLTKENIAQYLRKRTRWFCQLEYTYEDQVYPLVQIELLLLFERNTTDSGKRVIINASTPQQVTLNVTYIGNQPSTFDETFDETMA